MPAAPTIGCCTLPGPLDKVGGSELDRYARAEGAQSVDPGSPRHAGKRARAAAPILEGAPRTAAPEHSREETG